MTARCAVCFSMFATAVVLAGAVADAQTATPGSSPSASVVTATPTPALSTFLRSPTAAATSPGVSPFPAALPTGTPVPIGDVAPQRDESETGNAAVRAPAAPVVRAFRTPERAAAPAFVAPRGPAPEAPAADVDAGAGMRAPAPMRPPARGVTRTVVFHAVARTALQGLDLFVTYPRAAGDFVGSGDQVDCTTGSGPLTLNDHDDGTLRIIMANAQALSLPLDITCRFAVAAGAGIDGRDIDVRVNEVTVNNARGDPSLLSVGVEVR